MRTVFLVVGFSTCAEPVERQLFGDVDGTDLLVADAADVFPERVVAHFDATARLLPGGPTLGGGYHGNADPLVVVDPGVWPRVTLDGGDVRVLLYLDRAELQARVVALVDGTGPEGHGRVVLPPGESVEVLDQDEDRVQVSASTRAFTVEAWLTRSAVDQVWREDEISVESTEPDPEGDQRSVVGGTEILDRPSGHPLARLEGTPDEGWLMVTVVGEEVRGYVPIVLIRYGVRIEGWAHVDDLRDEHLGWGSSGGGCCCGETLYGWGWGPAMVPAGTWLRAGVDGPVVAVAIRDLVVSEDARMDGATLERHTLFGPVDLWVGPEDVR